MRRVVLHAGLPKTGTTSIQQFLRKNARALAKKGIMYSPVADESSLGNHNLLATAFCKYVPRIYVDTYLDDLDRLQQDGIAGWRKLLSDFRASDHETLLISGELFIRCDVKRLAEFVHEEMAQLEFSTTFYLRRPSTHYASSLQQHIKGANELLPFARRQSRWSQRLTQFRQLGDVTIREFNPDALVARDVVADFASTVGFGIDGLEHPPNANETVSAEGMELILKHRRLHFPNAPDRIMPQTTKLLERIRRRERALGDELRLTAPTLRSELGAYLDSDLDELGQLDELFGFRYEGIGVPDGTSIRTELDGLDGQVFDCISDLMPVDKHALRILQRHLERDGFTFS